ncbi:hypothetical protein [Enhygromyxa salina]|uniref:hypothetical protein n=1 Tax=Enhygromyxa salina TaxID=215803 RepID=UPI000695F059|nr:hypothetical protein [Enhygromyxa salina]
MSYLVVLVLFFAPPEHDYAQASAKLRAAIDGSTSQDRLPAIAALAEGIALHTRYPAEASTAVPDFVLEAHVILVRLYLAERDTLAAELAMDDLIRTARDQVPPVHSYGREVTALYEQRMNALHSAGTGILQVNCEIPCELVVNERWSAAPREELLLGTYRVWVRGANEYANWEYHEVELAEVGEPRVVTYREPNPNPNPKQAATPPPPISPPITSRPERRMIPRAAEIAGATVGVGLIITYAVLRGFDGKCRASGGRPTGATTQEACGHIYHIVPSTAALLGVGSGLLLVSGALLSIDEVRVGRLKGRQVTAGVTLKF